MSHLNEQLLKLTDWLKTTDIEIAFLLNPNNIAYYTGYESEPHERILALILFKDHTPLLFTPGLEAEDAKNSDWPYEVVGYLDTENPWQKIQVEIEKRTEKRTNWAVEKDFITLDRFEALTNSFPHAQFDVDLTSFVQEQKLIKTADEIAIMKEAGQWADFAFEVGFKAIKKGKAEQEIVAEIEYELKKKGISKMSFDTIVLAGDHAASPHGDPGSRKIVKDELILFDLGVVHNGYTSDATRTVAFGEPSAEAKKIYQIVLDAQLAAMAAIKPGVKASDLDKIARNIITEAGYGPYFNHRLGHGLGSTVHEFPSITETNDLVIQEGMCFSIEPGIYVPGVAGVRIEDCVYVTKNGCESFTRTPKELLYI